MRTIMTKRGAAWRGWMAVAWLALVPGAALAQPPATPSDRISTGIGYVFGGVGSVEGLSTFHVGGGGEALVKDAFGIGAEIGYLMPTDAASDGIGMLSLNAAYHFLPGRPVRRVRPFVSGGYTLGFRGGHANLFNVGGGVDVWLKRRVGLRLEVRDHVYTPGNHSAHFWGARFGITFR